VEAKAEMRKSKKRKVKFKWRPQVGDQVLAKSQPVSNAIDKMKEKAEMGESKKRKVKFKCRPQVGDQVLAKSHPVSKAYAKMKEKAEKRKSQKRNGNFRLQPQIGDQVLVKSQPVSHASKAITGKFQRLYEGPFVIKKVINVYLYKLQSKSGSIKGLFHISHLKPYVIPDQNV
jgi:hypothetical protein